MPVTHRKIVFKVSNIAMQGTWQYWENTVFYLFGMCHGFSIRSLRRDFILGVTDEFWEAAWRRSGPIWLYKAAIRPPVASLSCAFPPPPAAAPEPSKCHSNGDTCRNTCFGFRWYTCVVKSTKSTNFLKYHDIIISESCVALNFF